MSVYTGISLSGIGRNSEARPIFRLSRERRTLENQKIRGRAPRNGWYYVIFSSCFVAAEQCSRQVKQVHCACGFKSEIIYVKMEMQAMMSFVASGMFIIPFFRIPVGLFCETPRVNSGIFLQNCGKIPTHPKIRRAAVSRRPAPRW